jgi:AsmA-like C-terminal region
MMRPSDMARNGVVLCGLALVGVVAWAILFVWGEQRLRLDLGELARQSRADMGFVVREPVRIGFKPDLVMVSGSFAMLATPERAFVADRPAIMLDEPVFRLSASRRVPVPLAQALDRPRDIETALESALLKLLDHGFAGLLIRSGRLLIVTEHGSEEVVRDVNLEIDARRRGSFRVVGSFNARSETFTIDSLITPTFGRDSAIEDRVPMRVRLYSPSIDAVLDGRLDLGFGLQVAGLLEARLGTPDRLAKWLDLAPGLVSPFAAASVRGQMTWANGVLALSRSRFTFDGYEARGALQVSFNDNKPVLEGTLGFTTIDLSQHFVFGLGVPGSNLAPFADWATLPARLPWVSDIEADLRISADQLTYAGAPIGRAAGTLAIRRQNLLVDVSELDIADAQARVELNVDQSMLAARYTMRGKFNEPEQSVLLAELFGRDRLVGRTLVQFDVTGSGRTRGDVARDLQGRASVSMPNGGRVAADLAALRTALRAGGDREFAAADVTKNAMSLQRLETRFSIGRGRARIDHFTALTDDAVVTGSGLINAQDANVDVTLRFAPRSSRPIEPAEIQILGPWAAPRVRAPPPRLERSEVPSMVRGVP